MGNSNMNKAPQAENTRDRLLRDAAKLFIEHGYERTTMRTIADTTGLKLGSIAYYFPSKEDILYQVMLHVVELGEERALAAIKDHDTTIDRLRALIVVELDSFINESGSVVMKEWRCLAEERRKALLEHRKVYEDLWLEVLKDCQCEGLIRTNPLIARRFIHGAFAWSETWYSTTGLLKVEELANEVVKLVTQPGSAN